MSWTESIMSSLEKKYAEDRLTVLWDDELEAEKVKLKEYKSKLDKMDIKVWEKHTSFTSLSGDVVRTLRRHFGIEMCTLAWTKMYEMLEIFSLIKSPDVKFNSVHLCEAPGAFVCATNHYLRTKCGGVQWSWFAVSLNPYFEGNDLDTILDDDRLIVHTFNNWYFGEDDTGDIMERANIEGVWQKGKEMGPVHLITADGSVKCQSDPIDEEISTAPLHYCEMVTALGMLSKGGSFVLKMFTLFECSNITILFLLACVFEKVHIFKPATSRAENCEVYVVCQNYRPIPQEHLHVLLQHAGAHVFDDGVPIISRQLVPRTFLSQVIQCAFKFSEWQRTTIEENFRSFTKLTPERRKQTVLLRQMVAQEWVTRFRIKGLDKRERLVQNIDLTNSFGDESGAMTSPDKSRSGGEVPGHCPQRAEQKRMWQQIQKENKILSDERPIKRQKSDANFLCPHSDSVSSSSPTESFSLSDSIGMRLMRKKGCQDESSLDSNNQATTYPFVSNVRESRMGFEYENRYDLNRMDTPEYWLNDNVTLSWNGDTDSQLDVNKLNKRVKEWKIRVGASISFVKNSKFCAENVLSELQSERIGSWIWIDQAGFKELRKWLFPGDIVGKEFLGSKAALKLAVVDKALNFVGTEIDNDSKLYYAEMGPKSPASAYITWKKYSKNLTWVPVRVELLCDIDELNRTNCLREVVMATTNRFGLDLLIGDISSDKFRMFDTSGLARNQIEQKTARHLVEEVLNAANLLKRDGNFVCKVYDLNTRLSAGVLAIVNMLFKHITIIKPFVSCPATPERFLVCNGFTGYSSALVAYLNRVLQEMDHHYKSQTVLEIVPITDLLESGLRNKLRWWNEVAAVRETYAFKTLDKMYRENRIQERDPNATKFLKKLVLESIK